MLNWWRRRQRQREISSVLDCYRQSMAHYYQHTGSPRPPSMAEYSGVRWTPEEQAEIRLREQDIRRELIGLVILGLPVREGE